MVTGLKFNVADFIMYLYIVWFSWLIIKFKFKLVDCNDTVICRCCLFSKCARDTLSCMLNVGWCRRFFL